VIVAASGVTDYVLSCPQHGSFAGGVDALATSRDIRVTFDGLLGSPIAAGRTTGSAILFEAVSANHRLGAFRPSIGCIPASSKSPQTVAFTSGRGGGGRSTSVRTTLTARAGQPAAITPAGPPVTFSDRTMKLKAGAVQRASVSCAAGQKLVDGWSATAFGGPTPPDLALARLIRTRLEIHAHDVSVAVATEGSIRPGAQPQLQLGARCTQR